MEEKSYVEDVKEIMDEICPKIWKFPDFHPLPRGIAWLCQVTAALEFYNPSNLNFDVSDSFGVGKIQTIYGI